MNEVSGLLAEIQQGAQELNGASDSINLTIGAIEQKLVEANVGLECWLDSEPIFRGDGESWVDDRDAKHTGWKETVLGFAKLDEGWKLAVREREIDAKGLQQTVENREPTPLWRASRLLRIAALKKMPTLLQRIRYALDEALEAIASAKKLVE